MPAPPIDDYYSKANFSIAYKFVQYGHHFILMQISLENNQGSLLRNWYSAGANTTPELTSPPALQNSGTIVFTDN